MGTLRIDTSRPFFLLRRKNETGVWSCTGDIIRSRALADIPVREGKPAGETLDSVSLIPFCQARERGWPVHDGGEPIVTLVVDRAEYHELQDVLPALPQRANRIESLEYDSTSEQYEATIRRIVSEEIGSGQGANFVIARRCQGKIADFSANAVLGIFRSFLLNEFGTYWTFLLFDGERYVLGATPERHISARKGRVMMNPISGTFRKSAGSPRLDCDDFLRFLEDDKETFELFMVTDEELKIMCELCDKGGAIVGPLLKEMSRLVHTEYLLLGESDRDVVDLIAGSMFAPTVTGSPVLSAFRVIERYEAESRGYYGAMIALLGRDSDGQATLDAPITIRTLEIDATGNLVARVGATLVRGSDPASEVKETEAKLAGVLTAIESPSHQAPPRSRLLDVVDNEEVQIRLQRRNLYLSRFWFEPQRVSYNTVPALLGKSVTIIDNEDGFAMMLKRLIQQMGAHVAVVGFADYTDEFGDDDAADLTVVGPGPGDPTDDTDPKMVRIRRILDQLRAKRRPFFAECLSHQVLCHSLGLAVRSKEIPFQGAQRVIDLFGVTERVGFYNTFTAIADRELPGVEVAADPNTHEVHALRGDGFFSVQFHPESILTPRGFELTRDALVALISA